MMLLSTIGPLKCLTSPPDSLTSGSSLGQVELGWDDRHGFSHLTGLKVSTSAPSYQMLLQSMSWELP